MALNASKGAESLRMASSRDLEEELFDHHGADSLLRMLSSCDDLDDAPTNFEEDFAVGVGDDARAHADSHNSDFLEGMLADSAVSHMSGDFDRMLLAGSNGMLADSGISLMSGDFERTFLNEDESNPVMDSKPVEGDIMPLESFVAQEVKPQQPKRNSNKKEKGRSRHCRNKQSSTGRKQAQLREVNFDPATSSGLTRSLTRDRNPCHQHSGVVPLDSDIARSHNDLRQLSHEISYEDALQNLADSMKRTEQSRQQLMKHRALAGALATTQQQTQNGVALVQQPRQFIQQSPQQAASSTPQPSQLIEVSASGPAHHTVSLASQRNASPVHQSFQRPPVTASPTLSSRCQPVEYLSELPGDRSSIPAAYFSGSRGTLTNGLEQSRIQLKAYMGQVMTNSQNL
eukprot:CAMPEP_0172575958 /NCGR_PEP_ID=MMETSP1067-20121228/137478_1 /TAXON_ID=265564 ORGANISM="Thalassiosira punctigera, Strain Tpunct2005C2" /NCGR_SAMPLE_ID=MMETSP1067 /ASSEMBLY_ACC=CAM_ASM_000444 /LENGTH=400 /DNA_ID=CAMNT_0013368615 /DNA_START=67 /DNA_END=1269 /DNA_ORIENTATION=+